ncbi:hypothetical protein Q3G72_026018 [Acer saccharum]|nr:hypothetical protein Q3G72_026018 [Acer saccharum]
MKKRLSGLPSSLKFLPADDADAGIAPPQDGSDESSLADLPEEELDKATAKTGNQASSSAPKGKEKVGERSRPSVSVSLRISPALAVDDAGEQECLPNKQSDPRGSTADKAAAGEGGLGSAADEAVAMSHGVEKVGEPFNIAPVEVPSFTMPTSISSPAMVGNEVELEEPAANLDTRRRQPGKRKASFSPGRPTPKVPQVVAYVDSSSGDEEAGAGVQEIVIRTPPRDLAGTPTGDFIGSLPRATSATILPDADVGGSGPSSQPEAEQKASLAADEVKTIRDLLSFTQEAMLQAVEEVKSSYECKIKDLERQVLIVKSLSKQARLELEIQVVDHFKRSPTYDALLLIEFQREMVSAGEFFKMKNRATDRARTNWSLSIKKYVDTSLESLRVPITSAFSTYHACQKAGIDGEDPNVGLMPGKDYSAWMDDEENEIVWPSDDSFLRVCQIVGVVHTDQHSCVSHQPFWCHPEQFSSYPSALGLPFC